MASKTTTPVISAPVGGLNAVKSLMQMPADDALVLENFIPYPDKITTRPGATTHLTGLADPARRLWVYSSLTGADSLWVTTDAGVYNATSAGTVGTAAIALTQGKTIGLQFGTGANNYLLLVNGTDTLKQYDGTTWTSVPSFGSSATSKYSYIDSYRQRIFLVVKNSLDMEYLGPNSVSGSHTSYAFGSIFKLGGYIVASHSWTIDGGQGPDDFFVIVTSKGEVAIYLGSDPATWTLKGVFFIGRPLGTMPLFKYGGDLLFNCEAGLFPLSKALATVQIDRTIGITGKIKQLFADAASANFANDGWQIVAMPDIPLLLVNIPASPNQFQYVMHAETGSWAKFNGWNATCFARSGNNLYFAGGSKVYIVGAASDDGANITCTALSSYSKIGYAKKKRIVKILPYFISNGVFTYIMGIGQDFQTFGLNTTVVPGGSSSLALWGSGVWGTAVWSSSVITTQNWHTVPDTHSNWKSFYLQIVTNSVEVSYVGAELRVLQGSDY